MRLSNPILVFDLECTVNKDEKGNQLNKNIIEFGSILINKKDEILGRFNSLIKPKELDYTPETYKITKILKEDIEKAPSFEEFDRNLKEWLTNLEINIKRLRLAAWGTYFDINMLRKEYLNNDILYPFSGTAICIKSLVILYKMLLNQRMDKECSVEKVARQFCIGIDKDKLHRASYDAEIESYIFLDIMSSLSSLVDYNPRNCLAAGYYGFYGS